MPSSLTALACRLAAIRIDMRTLQRMQQAEVVRDYDYTDSEGNVHLVTQGTGGKWINNQIIEHGSGGKSIWEGVTHFGAHAGKSGGGAKTVAKATPSPSTLVGGRGPQAIKEAWAIDAYLRSTRKAPEKQEFNGVKGRDALVARATALREEERAAAAKLSVADAKTILAEQDRLEERLKSVTLSKQERADLNENLGSLKLHIEHARMAQGNNEALRTLLQEHALQAFANALRAAKEKSAEIAQWKSAPSKPQYLKDAAIGATFIMPKEHLASGRLASVVAHNPDGTVRVRILRTKEETNLPGNTLSLVNREPQKLPTATKTPKTSAAPKIAAQPPLGPMQEETPPTYSELIQQALRDMNNPKIGVNVYRDKQGNYRYGSTYHTYGKRTGPITPWSGAAKKEFASLDELYLAAKTGGRRTVQGQAIYAAQQSLREAEFSVARGKAMNNPNLPIFEARVQSIKDALARYQQGDLSMPQLLPAPKGETLDERAVRVAINGDRLWDWNEHVAQRTATLTGKPAPQYAAYRKAYEANYAERKKVDALIKDRQYQQELAAQQAKDEADIAAVENTPAWKALMTGARTVVTYEPVYEYQKTMERRTVIQVLEQHPNGYGIRVRTYRMGKGPASGETRWMSRADLARLIIGHEFVKILPEPKTTSQRATTPDLTRLALRLADVQTQVARLRREGAAG